MYCSKPTNTLLLVVRKRCVSTASTAKVTVAGERFSNQKTPFSRSRSEPILLDKRTTVRESSEKAESQHSWSPALSDHALNPVEALLNRGTSSAKKQQSIPGTIERKPPNANLLRSCDDTSASNTLSRLQEEFGRRYSEYVALNKWLDGRLAVFQQLKEDLAQVKDDSPQEQQLIFKLIVEERRLKDDQEYGEKREQLDECCAALVLIKARMASLLQKQPFTVASVAH